MALAAPRPIGLVSSQDTAISGSDHLQSLDSVDAQLSVMPCGVKAVNVSMCFSDAGTIGAADASPTQPDALEDAAHEGTKDWADEGMTHLSSGSDAGPAQETQTTPPVSISIATPDPVVVFLNSVTVAPPPPLIHTPPSATPPAPAAVRMKEATSGGGPARASGRLAAKPSSGLPALEMARLVLMRKEGIVVGDRPPTPNEIQKYKEIYNKELPPNFIDAIISLTAVTNPGMKKKQTGKADASSSEAGALATEA